MPVYMGEEEVIKKNMATAQKKIYTTDYLETLPEGTRAELIDGQLFYMAAPSTAHQALGGFLHFHLYRHIQTHKGNCQVFFAPLAVYLNKDKRTYLEPDLILVCDPRKLDQKGCHGAPDMIAEIVSLSTQSRDYLLKLAKYQEAGVKVYWILDMEQDSIYVYDLEKNKKSSYHFRDKVPVRLLGDLTIDFSEFQIPR